MIETPRVERRERWSKEAEMGVLGSCLLSARALEEVIGLLDVDDFYRPAHRLIWLEMKEIHNIGLYNAGCKGDSGGVDFVLLCQNLKDAGNLEDAGGEDYLLEVAQFTPSPANATIYANIVAELATLRRIEQSAKALIASIEEGDGIEDLLAQAAKIPDARKYSPDDLIQWADIDVQTIETGITTGDETLDAVTGFGFPNSQLSIVSAYQKGGKTSAMVDFMVGAAKAGHRVIYATFADLNPPRLKRRALKNACGFGGVPSGMDGYIAYEQALEAQNSKGFGYENILVYDARKHGKSVETFCSKVAAVHRKQPISAVYCDYAQKITSRTVSRSERTQQLEFVSEQLDDLAQRTGIAVVAGSQVSMRAGVGFITQYSVSLEQDAGLVLRISKDEKDENIRVIDIPFNRFGKEATLYGDWDDRLVKITNIRTEK